MKSILSGLSLGRVRLSVQLLMLLLTVWGANLVGYYAAEKISTALPALSCAYDTQNGGYCALVPLQHQLDHQVGAALARAQQVALQTFLPLLIILGSFLLAYLLLGKAFCAWVCPLGTVQEWLYRLGRKLGLARRTVAPTRLRWLRPVKWLVLLGLVFALPLAAGLGVAPHSAGNPYCDVCPSRIVTTLLTGQTDELALKVGGDTLGLTLSLMGNTVAGFVLLASLAVRQPFCRVCPMLAMNALARHVSLLRLDKREHSKCAQCGICSRACPMDIPEIHHQHGRRAFTEDCTLCGRCAEYCPDDQIIRVRVGSLAAFSSSRDYYKRQVKRETPDGERKVIRIARAKPADSGHGG